jgi:hypothetical protein
MWTTDDRPDLMLSVESESNQRQAPRHNVRLNLTFSGMNGTQMVMETATVSDLGINGFGLYTTRPLSPGTVLALFIESPDPEHDICIPEARVEWAEANRRGLSIRTIRSEDREKLQRLISSAHDELGER